MKIQVIDKSGKGFVTEELHGITQASWKQQLAQGSGEFSFNSPRFFSASIALHALHCIVSLCTGGGLLSGSAPADMAMVLQV